MRVAAIIPVLDEEGSLPAVLSALRGGPASRVVVVDNGSRDRSAAVARQAGAEVIVEPRRGYGSACLAGIAHLAADPPDVVLFLDGDGADDPRQAAAVVAPIARGEADLVIGSRTLGTRERGSLTPQQRVGNAVAAAAIRLIYRTRCTDLGPFRAVTWAALSRLAMVDRDYGWTVEMQVKAARLRLRVVEVPVSHRRRTAGSSKISGTLRGTIGAGRKILSTIARHALST